MALSLAACGASSSPTTATPAANAVADDRRAEITDLLTRAELVVVGRVSLGVCLDGCVGNIVIDDVLVGNASGTIGFISEPPRIPSSDDAPRILFLAREGDAARWRLLLPVDRELGLPPSLREHVEALHDAR